MRKIPWIMLLICLSHAAASEPSLKINANKSTTLTRSHLLKMKTDQFTMSESRAYLGIPVHYTAVKLCDLLKPYHVKSSDTIEFISSDHFYSLVPASVVMRCNKNSAIGYVAIETNSNPWPPLKYNEPNANHPKDGTAGPFAVIWRYPERNYISNEYWAWKLAEITIHSTVPKNAIMETPKTTDPHIQNGYFAYVSRCSGCHTLNGVGKATIGPDLNHSLNTSAIFGDDNTLKKFIRNPQSVRHKANDRMSGTNEEFLSNQDLDDLVRYLRYKTQQ